MTLIEETMLDTELQKTEHYVCCALPDGPHVTKTFCGLTVVDIVKLPAPGEDADCPECIRNCEDPSFPCPIGYECEVLP